MTLIKTFVALACIRKRISALFMWAWQVRPQGHTNNINKKLMNGKVYQIKIYIKQVIVIYDMIMYRSGTFICVFKFP